LIALYNSAYQDITDNATDEYMALFSQKTIQFVRAPDENVFIARKLLKRLTMLPMQIELIFHSFKPHRNLLPNPPFRVVAP